MSHLKRRFTKTQRIIAAVEERPYLYDHSQQGFKHVEEKNRLWEEVARIVYGRGDIATATKVKIQWKSLRDNYVKHLRKVKMGRAARPYKYGREMKFILPHITGARDRSAICAFNMNFDDSYDIKSESLELPKLERESDDDSRYSNMSTNHEHQQFSACATNMSQAASHSLVFATNNSQVTFNHALGLDSYKQSQNFGKFDFGAAVPSFCNKCINSYFYSHPVDAFFHGISQTVKQMKPETIAKIKKIVANVVVDAEIEGNTRVNV